MRHLKLFATTGVMLLAMAGFFPRAQAQTPEFRCPSAAVCAFSGSQFNGSHSYYPTRTHSNVWSIPPWVAFHGGDPNAKWINSINDNSGSIVWIAWFNTTTGWHNEKCFEPGRWSNLNANAPSNTFAAGLYIEYGVTSCSNGHRPNLPG